MRLRLLGVAVLASVIGFGGVGTPSAHASARSDQHSVNWNQHDTAVYVVSTLNLLRTTKGKSLAAVWMQRNGVTHFDVYADANQDDLFFISMKRVDNSIVATLAYQMGWPRPRSVTNTLTKFRVLSAPDKIVQSFQNDAKNLIGSFTSTLPA